MANYTKEEKSGFTLYRNHGGTAIGVAGAAILEQDGFAFRDLTGSGTLFPFEDWRLSFEHRAHDLAERLSPSEMIGLMVHTSSQLVPAMPGFSEITGTYNGKYFPDSTAEPWALTDQQKQMIVEKGIRHFLVFKLKNVESAVRWSNGMQALAEAQPFGIPVNLSSDPRHGAGGEEAEFREAACDVSQWPEGLALAALRDPALVRRFAQVMAKEYRALGIATFLGPQVDLGSDPRWFRVRDTFGADLDLTIEMSRSFCDGLQTTESSASGWGHDSVIAMAKHWPGGGTGEGGRDAHYPFGKFAVYPGGNFDAHLRPFLEGAFRLPGKTKTCAAVMPYYTISWQQDVKHHENVGNAYSEYIIRDLLIDKYDYEGVICTDWGIIRDMIPQIGMFLDGGRCHGVEESTEEERILRMILNGVNQFGGLDSRDKIDLAYQIGCERFGKDQMDSKLKLSAYKLLLNMFRVGLFDNPFLDEDESRAIVGCRDFVAQGLDAQRRSAVLLKDNAVLPLARGAKVYVPDRHVDEHYNFVRFLMPSEELPALSDAALSPYFTRAATPEEADAAIVFIDTPLGKGGYQFDALCHAPQPDAGYYPISLQYRPYTAATARAVSIAGGDPRESDGNRSYRGKTETTANSSDLDLVLDTRTRLGNKPLIVVLHVEKPAVVAEFEPAADAIIADFGVSKQVILEGLTGAYRFQGKLPVIFPADMETVEAHCEDVPTDIRPYTDINGSVYTLGFGL